MSTLVRDSDEIKIGEGASTFALLLLLFFSLTGAITTADWANGLGLLTWPAIGGLLLGFGLGKLERVRGLIAHIFALVVSFPITVALATFLEPETMTFEEKLIALLEETLRWFLQVMGGGTGSNEKIFVMQLALVVWLLAYAAGWWVYRNHNVWGALVPAGIMLVLTLFNSAPQLGLYFGFFLFSSLLLLVRMNLRSLEQVWRQSAIGYTSDINFDFMTYGTTFTLLLVLLVWIVPASAPGPGWLAIFEPFQESWQGFEGEFNRMFSTLRTVARPPAGTFFGSTLTMGGPISLGQRPVMQVNTSAGRYLRATIYEKYSSGGWISTYPDTINLAANEPRLETYQGLMRVPVTQTFKILLPSQNQLYAQAQPIRFDQAIEVRIGRPSSPDASPFAFDVANIRSRRSLHEGESYIAVSMVSAADEDSLRNDSVQYTNWITTTYLQLPDSLPARVRNLAKEITASDSNPYDKAASIEKYLRTHVTYNENVSAPPSDRDGVDYTLFDRPEGYCNYYASVMVVMARAVGIPARVASGYAQGEYTDGVYHIVESDSHSWPEVFFPSYGWIEFEPTASKPEIIRPKKPEVAPRNPDLNNSAEELRRQRERDLEMENESEGYGSAGVYGFTTPFWNEPRNVALALGGIIAAMILGALSVRQWRHARRMARLAPAARVYEEMLERSLWLGLREEIYATPLERARSINAVLPQAQTETEHLASSYTRERFGAQKLEAVDRAALSTAWAKWRSAWLRGWAAYLITRMLAPGRDFLSRSYDALERWNNRSGVS